MIPASEARRQVADMIERESAELQREAELAKKEAEKKKALLRETVLPSILLLIEAEIAKAIYYKMQYVRFYTTPWMEIKLLREDLDRTLQGLGYRVSFEGTLGETAYESDYIVDIRWSENG